MNKFGERSINILSGMIKIKTVSKMDEKTENIDEFVDYLKESFPNIFTVCDYIDFDGGMMLIWKGENKNKPLVLMSHLDVVDAVKEEWSYDPFCGTVLDGKILGRGSADTKGSLCAMLEAVEILIKEGFAPKHDVYILSSSREEIAGKDAEEMAKYFIDKKIVPSLVLDEGGAVMEKPMAGVKGRFAMMAMSERSSLKMIFKHANLEILQKIIKSLKIKSVLPTEVEEMFKRLAPNMSFPMSFIFKNIKIFKKLLVKLMPKISPQAGAMVKPDVKLVKEGEDVVLTLACTYYHNLEKIYSEILDLCNKFNLSYETVYCRISPKPTDFNKPQVKLAEKTVLRTFENTYPTPFVIFGGTDARHFVDIADCVIRFAPLIMNNEIISTVHKNNEYIFTESIIKAVEFYYNIINDFNY